MKSTKIFVAAFALCALCSTALANTTSYWSQAGVAQFYKGKFTGTALTDTGLITLGVKMEQTFSTPEPNLWAAAYDNKGDLWAGSGNKAILYRIRSGKGEGEEVAILPGSGISSIAVDRNNNVYAAVFPGGSIYVVRPGARAAVFAQIPASFVWDMKFAPSGDLYCVTGMPAAAYRINPSGIFKNLYVSSTERHFLSMFMDGDKFIYTGTSPNGLVLRVNIEAAEKGYAPPPEVSAPRMTTPRPSSDDAAQEDEFQPEPSMPVSPDGAGFAETAVERAPDPRVSVLIDMVEDEAYRLLPWKDGSFLIAANSEQSPQSPSAQQRRPGRVEPLSFMLPPKVPQSGQQLPLNPARVYLADPSGQSRVILEIPDPFILSMLPAGGDRVLIGSGNDGRFYNLDMKKETATLQELQASQILAIVGEGPKLRFVTGNPGAVFAPTGLMNDLGEFLSSVNDASTPAVYGNLDAVAFTPKGSALEFKTRTGNTPDPTDGTWSEWSAKEGRWPFRISSPPGRYVQYGATLLPTTDGQSPELREVKVFYLTANQPPRISSINVTPAPQSRRPTAPPSRTGAATTPPQMPSASAAASPGAAPASAAAAAAAVQQRAAIAPASTETNLIVGSIAASNDISVRWSASDPDQDSLRYSLQFRSLPDGQWTVLEKEFFESEYRWSTESVPDGRYEVKVIASDIESNTAERALSHEAITDPFIIDHTRPTIIISDLKKEGALHRVSGSATDNFSAISSIEYSVNDLKWRMVFPKDGLLDSMREEFSFSFDAPEGDGPHTLIVRARDFVGNTGSVSKSFK